MTTTELTCAHLYEVDSTFRGLVDLWDSERRCPTPLVDRCLELGMEKAADCCRWASSEPDRYPNDIDAAGYHGPYPGNGAGQYRWYVVGDLFYARDIPRGCIDDHLRMCPTAIGAILWLMDNWIIKEQQ